jgi:hypothetical protein
VAAREGFELMSDIIADLQAAGMWPTDEQLENAMSEEQAIKNAVFKSVKLKDVPASLLAAVEQGDKTALMKLMALADKASKSKSKKTSA